MYITLGTDAVKSDRRSAQSCSDTLNLDQLMNMCTNRPEDDALWQSRRLCGH